MRWNQFKMYPDRAVALGDLLLAAAQAGGGLDDDKLAVVHGQVAKVLGTSELPPGVLAYLDAFEPARFDIVRTCNKLGLIDPRDRIDAMKAVVLVVVSESPITREGRAFALRLAAQLGIAWGDALELIGLPRRPITRERPRVITNPRLRLEGQLYRDPRAC